MADKKTYYYLKLKEGFFDSEDMLLLQGMKDGYIYSDILLKLYLMSLRQDGRLMYRGIIPYTPDMVATITHHQVGTVEKAMKVLTSMGFIEILDNGAIYMLDIQNFIGRSSNEADRKREYRASITINDNVQTLEKQEWISVNDPACGAGATLIAAANIFHRKKINYQTRVLFTANDIDRVVAQMCYIQLSLLGCAGWVAVANTISNPVCGDPLMPVEKPGQEFWYTPFYFRGEWNCRRQIQIFKEMCGSWITPIEERNPGKITFYFDFEKGDYKCQNS